MKVFWKMRLSYGWSWQVVSFSFAVGECWRLKSHKGTIFCVIRDCPMINDHSTAIGDQMNQSLQSGIDKHPSPWQQWDRERAKRICTLQLFLKANHYLVTGEEEIAVSAAIFEPLPGDLTSRNIPYTPCGECIPWRWHHGMEMAGYMGNRTENLGLLEEMVYGRGWGFWAALLESRYKLPFHLVSQNQ